MYSYIYVDIFAYFVSYSTFAKIKTAATGLRMRHDYVFAKIKNENISQSQLFHDFAKQKSLREFQCIRYRKNNAEVNSDA